MGYRVFISADMEGVAGIVSQLQTLHGQAEYEVGRRLMTLEVNAAVEGALAAGATEVIVCDSHAHMQNLLPEVLHAEATLVRGGIRDSLQMQGIAHGFDAVFVTGAHAAAGTRNAVLDHTWVSTSVYNIRVDGRTLNEAGLNAIVAGFYGVPVVLVTGDKATIEQTREFLPQIEAVVVKDSNSRYCAASVHPSKARELIRARSEAVLSDLARFQPVPVGEELTLEIDFLRTDMADAAALVPGVTRVASRSIEFKADPETVFRVQELILYRLRYEPFGF